MKRGALIQSMQEQEFLGHGWREVKWLPLATAVVYDLGGPWFRPDQPTRLTVPAGVGWVQVAANIALKDPWDGHAVLRIAKNGGVFSGQPGQTVGQGIYWSRINIASAPLQVKPGDYFTVEANHNRRNRPQVLGLEHESWFSVWALD